MEKEEKSVESKITMEKEEKSMESKATTEKEKKKVESKPTTEKKYPPIKSKIKKLKRKNLIPLNKEKIKLCSYEKCQKETKNKGNKMSCKGCNEVFYCNAECQKNDWKNHAKTCQYPNKHSGNPVLRMIADDEKVAKNCIELMVKYIEEEPTVNWWLHEMSKMYHIQFRAPGIVVLDFSYLENLEYYASEREDFKDEIISFIDNLSYLPNFHKFVQTSKQYKKLVETYDIKTSFLLLVSVPIFDKYIYQVLTTIKYITDKEKRIKKDLVSPAYPVDMDGIEFRKKYVKNFFEIEKLYNLDVSLFKEIHQKLFEYINTNNEYKTIIDFPNVAIIINCAKTKEKE